MCQALRLSFLLQVQVPFAPGFVSFAKAVEPLASAGEKKKITTVSSAVQETLQW